MKNKLNIKEVTLLSVEEFQKCEKNIPLLREWWWLRSPGFGSDYAASVGYDGYVYRSGYSVDYGNHVVRPALRIGNLDSLNLNIKDEFEFAGRKWTVISKTLAICNDHIGYHCFREDYRALDANKFESSDVKRFLDNWAEKHIFNSKKSQQKRNVMSNPTKQTSLKNPQDIETLYGAFATLGHAPELKIQEIPVIKANSEYLELESEHPVSKNSKTDWFPLDKINSVLRAGDKSFAFYSEDFERCAIWLRNFKRHLLEYHKNQCEFLKNIEVQLEESQNVPPMNFH